MIGGSCIVAPTGEIAAQAVTEADEVIMANCDLRLAENFRKHVFNFEKHRRPEHYALTSKERVLASRWENSFRRNVAERTDADYTNKIVLFAFLNSSINREASRERAFA